MSIDSHLIRSSDFEKKRQLNEHKEYPQKLIRYEDMKFFAEGNMDEVQRLIREGYDLSSRGNKALSLALRNGHIDIVELIKDLTSYKVNAL